MKLSVFAYSRCGLDTARKISACFPGDIVRLSAPERLANGEVTAVPSDSESFYGEAFGNSDAVIFVGSCGIAMRCIAPHVRDKRTDPAVLCVDELGQFVISLLSGHIGGANALAEALAEKLGATPVITTATDINRRFSVDAWAAERGYVIGDMHTAKAVSASILEENIPLCSDFPIISGLPGGIVLGSCGALGICVSYYKKSPFSETLNIIPRVLHLGVGCRRGTSAQAIESAVRAVFEENKIDPRAVKCVSSVDLKSDEPGILHFCTENGLKAEFYTADRLRAVQGDFAASDFVKLVTGVDNVCERAAMIGAARLIVGKTAVHGVTVAVAAEDLEVSFE